jgi:UDP-glucuronate 4-epimerase
LVTGGAGFIGSHTVERLLLAGHDVSVIDDLNDFYSPSFKRDNLAAIGKIRPIRFHLCDICDEKRVPEILANDRPDAVIHLAARAGVRPSLEDPLLYERVNVRGTMVLLAAARKLGIPKFVFGSSSSVYGIANRIPFSEQDTSLSPISPYAATKIAGEKMCYTYSHLYGIGVVCLRFFTVYGPRQRPDLAIRKFTEMIERGEPIPVFGDGSSGRDYTYVDDIVQGIMAALHLQTRFEVFNLGNSSPVTLDTLIHTLEDCLGKEAIIRRLEDQAGDVPITCADISKANAELNYRPATRFDDGIAKFVEWRRGQSRPSPQPVPDSAERTVLTNR